MELRRTRNLVRRSVALGLTLGVVDAEFDTRIVRPVGTREADGTANLRSRSRDIDLRAAHVELRTAGRARAMQGDEFSPEEILARSDTRWHSHLRPPAVVDHAVDTPVSRAVETVFGDFEPLETRGGRISGIGDLCHVKDSRPLVRLRDRVVGVV